MPYNKSIKHNLRSFGILAILFAALALISTSLIKEIIRNNAIDNEIRRIEDEASRLESKNLEIMNLIKQLGSADFLEKEARLKLGLQKPGEKVVVINRIGENAAAGNFAESESIPNFQKWWYYFFRQNNGN